MWNPRPWELSDALVLFLGACEHLQCGGCSRWNLGGWRQSRWLEHSNLLYITVIKTMLSNCHTYQSSRKSAVSVFFHQVGCLLVSPGDWGELSDDEQEENRSQPVLLSWNWHFRIQGWALCSRWARPVFWGDKQEMMLMMYPCFFFLDCYFVTNSGM